MKAGAKVIVLGQLASQEFERKGEVPPEQDLLDLEHRAEATFAQDGEHAVLVADDRAHQVLGPHRFVRRLEAVRLVQPEPTLLTEALVGDVLGLAPWASQRGVHGQRRILT